MLAREDKDGTNTQKVLSTVILGADSVAAPGVAKQVLFNDWGSEGSSSPLLSTRLTLAYKDFTMQQKWGKSQIYYGDSTIYIG
jgi:hypothetical protein